MSRLRLATVPYRQPVVNSTREAELRSSTPYGTTLELLGASLESGPFRRDHVSHRGRNWWLVSVGVVDNLRTLDHLDPETVEALSL